MLEDFEFVWERDFYSLYLEKKGVEKLIFTIEVFGKQIGPEEKRKPIGFASFEINN